MSSFENFVKCRVVSPVAVGATDIALYEAVAPFNLPPEAGGILVLTDSPNNPSVIEVIRYGYRNALGLYEVQRGQEGTAAIAWTGPVYCYQSLMADDFQALLDSKVDKAAGQSLMTDAERSKLGGIQAGAQVNSVTSVAGKTGAVSLTKADVGLGNVDNTSDANKPVSTAQQTALNAKAPLASPVLTGSPKAPTPLTTDNSTLLATTAFVKAVVAALVDSSPAALDTLNELAAALGDDPNFATTMTNALALKAPLASPALTGNPTAPTPAAEDADTSIATTAFVRAAMGLFGIGAQTISTEVDLDLYKTGGSFVTPSTGLLNLPVGWGQGRHIVLVGGGTNYTSQLLFGGSVNHGRVAQRAWNGTAWSAWQEIWHTGNLVKQTGPTDTTAGAMLAVGAANLLTAAASEGFDVLKGSRFVRAGTEGPMGVTICGGLTIGVTGAIEQQLAMRLGRAFFRSKGDTDSEWRELFHTRNLLGTVSQAGGVPTGAIIERGSNANGEYIRWADGTQICTRTVPLGTYTEAKNGAALGDYTMPASFTAVDHVSADIHVNSASAAYSTALYATTGNTGLNTWYRVATRALQVNSDSSVGVTLLLTAKGRWF